MTLVDLGVVASIVGSLGALVAVIGAAILRRLSHLDVCIDNARIDARTTAEGVRDALTDHQEHVRSELKADQERIRGELVIEEERTRSEMAAYVREDNAAHLRIERAVGWLTGRAGAPLNVAVGDDLLPSSRQSPASGDADPSPPPAATRE